MAKLLVDFAQQNKHLIPEGVKYIARELTGEVCGFAGIPNRPVGEQKWQGDGKVSLGIHGKHAEGSWHHHYLCVSTMGLYARGTGSAEVSPINSASLKTRYPERIFEKKPEDYGLACAYAAKVKNCIERDIRFELTFQQFVDLFHETTCYFTGITLGHYSDPTRLDQHSIERLDPTKGYVKGNCVAASALINGHKGALDKFLLSEVEDELKLKLLYKAEYVLRKRIKEKKEKEAKRIAEASPERLAFESRYPMFPKQ